MARPDFSERRGAQLRLGRLSGPPLIVRFIGLVIGALIAAQLATLLLTLVLPPASPRDYALADIAAALRGADDGADRFDRVEQAGPPDFSSRGWFVSQTSRAKLAGLLGLPIGEVALGFYTQLPVGGSVDAVAAPQRLPADAERTRRRIIGAIEPGDVDLGVTMSGATPRLVQVALLQQMPGGPPGGGFPGGGPPGGGFPGGGLPGGGFPQSLPQPMRARPPMSSPPPTVTRAPPAAQSPPLPNAASPVGPASAPPAGAVPPGAGTPPPPAPAVQPPFVAVPTLPPSSPLLEPPARSTGGPSRRDEPPSARAPSVEPAAAPRPAPAPAIAAAPPPAATEVPVAAASAAARDTASPPGKSLPIVRPATGLFGLAPSPFVEGDFVAGMRLADGRWIVVSPRAEGFPSAWQRRVALWFLLSLLAVAPIAWLFARRIVGPLNDFAEAADILGRDPGAAVLPLGGPAEIGRAAHAFNQMQNRLRSFVDDRTAMIGAISHDLRTPLTRLRFRIEDVPDEQQDALRGEVDEMEAMISSVIAFMRDASTPHARERRDLAEIVDDVIEDASLLGEVKAGRVESAIVDVDPLGIRRVLDNLLTNAIKYGGGRARVALRIEASCAVADVVDDGPGVPDGELDRIFEPFYRSEAARASGREGSGLGLAVCRSIARAHGGDVALFRAADGFTARVTLPLAFGDDRRAA